MIICTREHTAHHTLMVGNEESTDVSLSEEVANKVSEDEQEPQLKYEQLAGDVAALVVTDEISCLRLSDKILAVGTIKGRVHLLDYSGNQVGGRNPASNIATRPCSKRTQDLLL